MKRQTCRRVHGKGFNRRAVESLIKSGALDNLGSNRHEMLNNLPFIIDELDDSRRRNLDGQIGFFDLLNNESDSEYVMKSFAEFSNNELLAMEKETTGLYISSHPMNEYSELIKKLKCDRITDIVNCDEDDNDYYDSASVKVMGIVNGITRKQTKSGETMAFVTLEDVSGSIEVIIFPKLFAKYANIINNGVGLFVGGRLSVREEEKSKIILDFAETLESVKDKQSRKNGLFIRVDNNQSRKYFDCAKYLQDNSVAGNVPLYFYFSDTKKYFPTKKIAVNDELIKGLKQIVGEQNVILQK